MIPNSPSTRPTMLYDGDCGVCRAAVDRWREATGDRIEYAPYQEAAARFPQIDERQFRRAVHLVEADGRVSRGAEAVFRAMALCGRKRWLLWLYEHLPPARFASDKAYRWYAANRKPIALVRRVWWGKDLKPPTYHIARSLFLRLLGLVYLIAFVSLWTQIDGLVGDRGILPAENCLGTVKDRIGIRFPPPSPIAHIWELPTLAWISPHDGFLNFLCAAGAVLSGALILGFAPLPVVVLLWLDYLSLYQVGQDFLSFQWDILLLETGVAAIFLAPLALRSRLLGDRHPPRLAIFLIWWILFRLMLESGAVKLTWNQWAILPDGTRLPNTWSSLTALDFHYWTQPLPIWTSWYFAKLPEWFQKLSVLFVFLVELVLPWLIFGPRLLRYIACSGIMLLMLLIAATGNYNFFNLLTIVLAIMLLDDKAWPRFLRRRIRGIDWPVLASPTRLRTFVLIPFTAIALVQGAIDLRQAIAPGMGPRFSLTSALDLEQFMLVNSYGLFRQMTEKRPEIIIEGSNDGTSWKPYEFRWKPGDLARPPRFCTPHQPRLDWQMWFAALGHLDPWFQPFLKRLLEGEPKVLGLLAENPFPDAPPKFIHIVLYEYHFTDADERRQTGNWWRREQIGVSSEISLTK